MFSFYIDTDALCSFVGLNKIRVGLTQTCVCLTEMRLKDSTIHPIHEWFFISMLSNNHCSCID